MHEAEHLPWPNVRGKRCLEVGPEEGGLASELRERGAADVVVVDVAEVAGAPERISPDALGVFDLVVARDLVPATRDPIPVLLAIHEVARGMLLSIEPIELWLSVLARGRPLLRPVGEGEDVRFRLNGAGHKELLVTTGFTVERTSRPFVTAADAPPTGPAGWRSQVRRAGLRALTGAREDGVLRRALLARALP